MGTIAIVVGSIAVGFALFPTVLFLLRNVLPPTLFMPDDW